MTIDERMRTLGLTLPPATAPAANYVPYVREGGLVFIAGQGLFDASGKLQYVGRVGREVAEAQGYQAARLTALTCLAQVRACMGSLEQVRRILQVRGFVAGPPDFTNHLQVINGART